MKIEKIGNLFKIKTDNGFFFSKPVYFNNIKSLADTSIGKSEDLTFTNKEDAEFCLKILPQTNSNLDINDIVIGGMSQLSKIFSHYNINPKEYNWADCWAETGIWSLILNKMIKKNILVVDYNFSGSELDGIKNNPNFIIKEIDTDTNQLPKEITAVFIRSLNAENGLLSIIKKNPQIELIICVPEGGSSLDSPKKINWIRKKCSKNLKGYFEEFSIDLLNSTFSLKGSSSNIVVPKFNFPVIFMRKRK